ncbi:MAG: ABC transporter permease subunit, partial [Candidatus Latescibacterota bacterium]
ELQAIAAAVIGGVHITGGRGSAAGIALGVLLIGQLANALVLLHVPAYWEDLFLGAVILSTLVLEKREERR